MKKIIYTLIFTALTAMQTFAQTDLPVVVGGSQKGELNATMEILSKGGTKGFMPPRLTTTQITTLTSKLTAASEGLTVFNIDTDCLQYWKGTKWSDCSTYSSAEVTVTCASTSIKGVYNVDKVVTDSEYLSIQMNVTKGGPFVFYTDAKNGVRFYLSTILEVGNNQVISVPAIGMPKAAGTFAYNLFDQSGNTICSAISTTMVENKAGFTIKCAESFIAGAFYDNIPVNGQQMTVKIATSTAGNYYIKTNVVNGLWFEGTGNINFGTTEIVLDAKGIATVPNGDTGLRTFNLLDKNGVALGCSVSTTIMASKSDFTISCNGALLEGDGVKPFHAFFNGYKFTDADVLKITINATRTGPINLTTDPSIPLVYSYVGVIDKLGSQVLTLKATKSSLVYNGSYPEEGLALFDLKFLNFGNSFGCTRSIFFRIEEDLAKITVEKGIVNPNIQTDINVFKNIKLFEAIASPGKEVLIYVRIPAPGGLFEIKGTANGITLYSAGTISGSGTAPGNLAGMYVTMTGTLLALGEATFPMYDVLTGNLIGGCTINFNGN